MILGVQHRLINRVGLTLLLLLYRETMATEGQTGDTIRSALLFVMQMIVKRHVAVVS
jgi:hypothetical protein